MNTAVNIIKSIKACLARFKKLHIVVFGDVILDVYLCGEVKRISPEAPVPILNTERYDYRIGGGGNVACNLANMGVNVTLASVIGKDKNGQYVLDYLKENKLSSSGIISTDKRKTSIKTRVIAQNQQVVRIDDEDTHELDDRLTKKLIDNIKNLPQTIDGIIISDYGKGLVNRKSLELVIAYAKSRGIFLAMDPKQRNFGFYKDIDVMTPNHFEAAEDVGRRCETLEEVKSAGKEIITKHNLCQLLITRGKKGVTLFDNTPTPSIKKSSKRKNKPPLKSKITRLPRIYNLPTFNRSLFDVSGAGDTVIALYTSSYLASRDAYLSALIANISAGVVVSRFGTSPITRKDFLMEIENKQLLKKIMQGKYHES